jgi:hypothetical protein
MENAGLGRTAAIISVLTIAYFAAAAIATHLANPQYDLVRDYISDYAVGPNGWASPAGSESAR